MDYISKLPDEILELIFSYLNGPTLWRCLSVDKNFRRNSNQNKLWKISVYAIGLNVHDIPPPRNLSSFGLCTLAKEWSEAKKRAWKWKMNKIQCIPIQNDPLCNHRERFMCFNSKKKTVEIMVASNYTLKSICSFTSSDSLFHSQHISGDMNCNYCTIITLTLVLVYKGYHNINFHMALGIKDGHAIDVTDCLSSYSPEKGDYTYHFEPVFNDVDILLVPVRCSEQSSRIFHIVDLKKRAIYPLAIYNVEKFGPVCGKHLPANVDKHLVIFRLNGELCYIQRIQSFEEVYFNKRYFAFHAGSKIIIKDISTNITIRSIELPEGSLFSMNFYLDYFYILNAETLNLGAYEIKTGFIAWEKFVGCIINGTRNITHTVQSGYICLYANPPNKLHCFDAYSGRKVKEPNRYCYSDLRPLQSGCLNYNFLYMTIR